LAVQMILLHISIKNNQISQAKIFQISTFKTTQMLTLFGCKGSIFAAKILQMQNALCWAIFFCLNKI
jgi:hypothetical protein